mgnify:CR=1 FL=1
MKLLGIFRFELAYQLRRLGIPVVIGDARSPETLQALAPRVAGFRRGLRVMFFSVEEWALTGSAQYVEALGVAERAVLLDHLTKGRFMLGVGPGSLPTDAIMLGVRDVARVELGSKDYDFVGRINGKPAGEFTISMLVAPGAFTVGGALSLTRLVVVGAGGAITVSSPRVMVPGVEEALPVPRDAASPFDAEISSVAV